MKSGLSTSQFDLSEEEMVQYQNSADRRGLVNYFYRHEEYNTQPMAAILEQRPGWFDGEVEFQGQQCRRGVWFMRWQSREAEEQYKSTVKWYYRCITTVTRGKKRQVPEVKLAVDLFIEDMKSHGMMGYETWHAYFETIDLLG